MTAGPTAFPLSVLFILASSFLILWTSWTVLLIRVWTLAHGPHGWDFLFLKSPPSPMISSCSVLYSQSNNYSPILICQSLIPSLIVMGLLSITAAFLNPFSQPNNRNNGEKAPQAMGGDVDHRGSASIKRLLPRDRERDRKCVCLCVWGGRYNPSAEVLKGNNSYLSSGVLILTVSRGTGWAGRDAQGAGSGA